MHVLLSLATTRARRSRLAFFIAKFLVHIKDFLNKYFIKTFYFHVKFNVYRYLRENLLI
jgi:hypothetical protein